MDKIESLAAHVSELNLNEEHLVKSFVNMVVENHFKNELKKDFLFQDGSQDVKAIANMLTVAGADVLNESAIEAAVDVAMKGIDGFLKMDRPSRFSKIVSFVDFFGKKSGFDDTFMKLWKKPLRGLLNAVKEKQFQLEDATAVADLWLQIIKYGKGVSFVDIQLWEEVLSICIVLQEEGSKTTVVRANGLEKQKQMMPILFLISTKLNANIEDDKFQSLLDWTFGVAQSPSQKMYSDMVIEAAILCSQKCYSRGMEMLAKWLPSASVAKFVDPTAEIAVHVFLSKLVDYELKNGTHHDVDTCKQIIEVGNLFFSKLTPSMKAHAPGATHRLINFYKREINQIGRIVNSNLSLKQMFDSLLKRANEQDQGLGEKQQ